MPTRQKSDDTLPGLKAVVVLIIATATVVSAIWGFFFVKTSELKNEQISILEKRNAELKETGAVPEAYARLEQRLIPLSIAFQLDPFDGRVNLGAGMSGPTAVTHLIISMDQLRKERKYDLAAQKLDEIARIYPGFKGLPYFRFALNSDKGNDKEALAFADQAISALPDDKRVLPAYEYAVKAHLRNGEKGRAEALCLKVAQLEPENKRWIEFFTNVFGYTPAGPSPTNGSSQ